MIFEYQQLAALLQQPLFDSLIALVRRRFVICVGKHRIRAELCRKLDNRIDSVRVPHDQCGTAPSQ